MIKIGIVGAGPSGLFVYKRLIETGNTNFQIELFEKKDVLGCGIPYGKEGALPEHITNVSGNEIPELPVGLTDWIKKQSPEMLQHYNIKQKDFDAYNVLPRYYLVNTWKTNLMYYKCRPGKTILCLRFIKI